MPDRHPFAALVLGICLIAAAAILATTWRGNVKIAQTLDVVGSAKMDLMSDLGRLTCSLQASGSTAEAAYTALQGQIPILTEYLAGMGLTGDAIEPSPINTWTVDEFDSNGRPTGRVLSYEAQQQFVVESKDVDLIKRVSLDLASLVTKGVDIHTQSPEYLYLELSDVKVEVQALAAKDAMERARRIAEASGAKIGPIRDATVGVLQITPQHSTMVSDYGINDNSSIEKQITAVVHAKFAIQ